MKSAKKQGKIIFQDQVFSGDRWIDNYRKNSVPRLSIILSKHLLTRKWSFGFENFLKIKTFFPTKNIFNHFKANESFVSARVVKLPLNVLERFSLRQNKQLSCFSIRVDNPWTGIQHQNSCGWTSCQQLALTSLYLNSICISTKSY